MADWYYIDLEFLLPPDPECLVAANAWLQEADYDAPVLTAKGLRAKSWRSPLVADATLAKRLGEMGLVCRLRMVRDPGWGLTPGQVLPQTPWIPSSPLAAEPGRDELYGLLHRAVGEVTDAVLKGDITAALASARAMGWRP